VIQGIISAIFWILLIYIIFGWYISYQAKVEHKKLVNEVKSYQPAISHWKGKKFLIIANPYGGRRMGLNIVQDIVEPMFKKSGIEWTTIQTTHAGHAKEICATYNLSPYCGIVILSGDGTLSEVTNGLASRVRSKEELFELFKNIPLAIVPAGSSNGFSTSVGGTNPFIATKNIIEGTAQPIDISEVKMKDSTKWDCMHVSWGSAEFHDTLQENMRWMEPAIRNVLAPIASMIWKPSYKAKVYILPVDLTPEQRKKGHYSDPELLEAGPGEYRIIHDSLFLAASINMPDVAYDVKLTPNVSPCEGAVDMLIIRSKISRWMLLKFFLKVEHGTHIFFDWMEIYKIKGFILEAETKCDASLSGELIPCEKMDVTVHKGALYCIFLDKKIK